MKKLKRSTMISVRWDQEDIDDIEKRVQSEENPSGKFKDVSHGIRDLTRLGLKLLDYQEVMKDPLQSKEFIEKMQEFIRTEQTQQFIETLSDQQLNGFMMQCQMEKDSRYKNARLF